MVQSRYRNQRHDPVIKAWLLGVAVLVFLIIMVGGATRLTDSGLSIAHWSPIHGIIPPLSQSDWNQEFGLYKNIPEFKIQNHDMSLNEFKFIFWWEWAHRLLGRIVGIAFILPYIFFVITKRIKGGDIIIYLSVGLLIGFQGFVGWWMVASGLSGNRIDVAPYRLASHLGLAFLLFGILISIAAEKPRNSAKQSNLFFTLMVFVYLQVILGALVAGNRAGFIFNDWPTIGGKYLPAAYLTLKPLWHNFFENQMNTQFNHRVWGYIILLFAISINFMKSNFNKTYSVVLTLLIILQISLGVFVLKIFGEFTPPNMIGVLAGVAHQAFAAMVFGFCVYFWRKSDSRN